MTATSTRIGEAATAAADTMNATADYVSKTTDTVRKELGSTDRRMREIVAEYPLTCFFGAVMTGYLVGRIARRL